MSEENKSEKSLIRYIIATTLILLTFTMILVLITIEQGKDVVRSWEETTPEKTSCEILQSKIELRDEIGQPWFVPVDWEALDAQFDRLWDEMYCDDQFSEYWKGEDWKYESDI